MNRELLIAGSQGPAAGLPGAGYLIGSGTQHALARAVTVLTAPVATTRRIAFFSTTPGTGTSTVMHLVARILAKHRTGRVLASTTVPFLGYRDAYPSPPQEYLAPLPEDLHDQLRMRGRVWLSEPDIDDRFFDIHCTDYGVQTPDTGAVRAATDAHATCVVTSFERAHAEPAVALAEALVLRSPSAPVVIAFTNPKRYRTTWPKRVAPSLSAASVRIGFDPRLGGNRPPSYRTTQALTFLAAQLLSATRGAAQ